MHGTKPPYPTGRGPLQAARRHAQRLDTKCRQRWGVTFAVFRSLKLVYQILAIALVMLLVENGLAPTYGAATALVLISGPEALETWLVRQGHLPERTGGGGDGGGNTATDGGDEQRAADAPAPEARE